MKIFLLVLSFAAMGMVAEAEAFVCPNQTYAVVPITGATGGTASSCGIANVDLLGGTVSTPGVNTAKISELELYLGLGLGASAPLPFMPVVGSAVQFAGFTVPGGSKLNFSWESVFEEGGAGSLFYVLNGNLTVLDVILPEGQSLPGASNVGTATVDLLDGSNTFAFGAVSLVNSNSTISQVAFDPQLSITNLAVTQTGVPEPGTVGLMGAGLGGLVAWMRRRG
jgi:hypothetical protein